jgi:YVTN family beta-propeller protein
MRLVTLLLAALLAGCASMPVRLPNLERGWEEAYLGAPDAFLEKAVVGPMDDGTYVVPTTQLIDPAGDTILFPGRPTGLALRPDASLLAIKNRTDLVFLDPLTHDIRQTLPLPAGGNSFRGILWTDNDTVWTTSSAKDLHVALARPDGTFAWGAPIVLPGPQGPASNSAPGGLAYDEPRGLMYVCLSRNNSIGIIDLAAGELIAEIPVGIAPYDILLDGDRAFVSNWGGRRPRPGDLTGPTSGSEIVIDAAGIASSGTISVLDMAAQQVVGEVEVELHPCGIALAPDGNRLYVANANSDSVSVVDTGAMHAVARWSTQPMARLPLGSGPNALTLTADGRTLYVANGGNNCIAVLDTADGALRGLIPTGWYPGDVMLSPDEAVLYVANTKGIGSRYPAANPQMKLERFGPDWYGSNTHDHMGSVTLVPTPSPAELEQYTYRVGANMRLPRMAAVLDLPRAAPTVLPVPTRPGEVSVFKHVMYIIKENRTYDQIFGDMPQGKGDPGLCHFGWDVTPNHHALAEEFVLFDNFYCNGVLSADGHQWTDEGYVTDYLEKQFGGFTRSYPYDGDDALAYASSGFIWDHVLNAGLTFRNYGEMVKAVIEPNSATWTDIYQDYLHGTRNVSIRATTLVRGLEPYICPTYVGFPGKVQDVYRAEEFLKEFRLAEAAGEWHNFTIMLLPNDHTVGTREGYPTPRATVADNDLALGRIVEAVTKSRFWPETVIFVVEDDPQAGLDHIDGHRTVALCISPYTKRRIVDSTHYNQTSMLRTMELIMGLNPMTQFTLAANPMLECFTETPDFTPYQARPNIIPLDEMNPPLAALRGKQLYYAQKSMEMPLDDIDQADEGLFNRIIWHSVKGYDTPYPDLARRAEVGATAWNAPKPHKKD